jgi:hypothetical protein
VDRVRLASSVEHLDVGIRTGWTSDRFRPLEFAELSLGLSFEGVYPTTAVNSSFVDDIVVIDREALATVIDLLEHQGAAS